MQERHLFGHHAEGLATEIGYLAEGFFQLGFIPVFSREQSLVRFQSDHAQGLSEVVMKLGADAPCLFANVEFQKFLGRAQGAGDGPQDAAELFEEQKLVVIACELAFLEHEVHSPYG